MNGTSFEHLLMRFRRLVDEAPHAPLFQWVDPEKGRVTRVTRVEAWQNGLGVRDRLLKRRELSPGDRVLLVYPPGLEFIWALIGAMSAGLCPVPAYPPLPARVESGMAALEGLLLDAGARVALTNRAYRWVVRGMRARSFLGRSRLPQLDWIVTDGSPGRDERGVPAVSPDAVAFLQYTSGSTRTPRGVQITWGNLQHQLRINRETMGLTSESRAVLWVPQYHDLGLISGIMSALWGNGELILTSPASFLRDPAVWMQLVSDHRATHTAAPNFAFGLLLRKTTPAQRAAWDLSHLRVLMTAAEPIDAELMDRFMAAMAPAGLRPETLFPAYGLAEHTVGVTLGGRKRLQADREALQTEGRYRPAVDGAASVTLVGCGEAASEVELKVMSIQLHQPLFDGHIGEIWVRSPSVALGYERRPEETAQTFQARLPHEEGHWLRTGDLGLLYEGELFITGRFKDLIIIGGRNLAPQDLEQTISDRVAGVRPGCVAAFAIPGQDTEALAVVADLRDGVDPAAVADQIQAALVAEHGLRPARLILGRAGLVQKTTSGKIRRRSTRAALLSGELLRDPALLRTWTAEGADSGTMVPHTDPLREVVDRLETLEPEAQLAAMLEALRVTFDAALDEDVAWTILGIDSISSIELVLRLEAGLGLTLPTRILFDQPTPRRLAMELLRRLGHLVVEESRPVQRLGTWPRRFVPRADLRIAIVGGGPAGLAAADALLAQGYRAVTLFEQSEAVGGKVLSVTVDGHSLELGAQMLPENYETVASVAERVGVPLVPSTGYAAARGDSRSLVNQQLEEADVWWTRLQAAAGGTFGRDWVGGRGARSTALATPLRAWLERHDLLPLPELVRSLWIDFGYGELDLAVPAYFFVEYLRMAVATPRLTHRCEGGNQRLLEAMAADLVAQGAQLRLSTAVVQITPDKDTVLLTPAGGPPEVFDEVILAAPHTLARALPLGEPLRALLSRYRTLRYGIVIARTEGLALDQRVIPVDPSWSDGLISLIMPMGDGLVSLTAYGPPLSDTDPQAEAQAIERSIEAVLARLGGRLVEVCCLKMWDYFPHLLPEDMSTMLDLEALQGARGLWVTGAAVSFEAVEHVMRHARSLVETAFPAIAELPAELQPLVLPLQEAPEGTIWPPPASSTWCLGPQASHLGLLNTLAGGLITIRGPQHPDTLRAVLRWLDRSVEALRIRVVLRPDGVGLSLHTDEPPPPLWRDLSGEPDPRAAAQAWLRELADQPFTPDDPRLYRVGIGRLDAQTSVLLLVTQHTLMDGDGLMSLASAMCMGLAQGCPPPHRLPIPPLLEEVATADITLEQRLEAALDHWRSRLSTLPDVPPPAPPGPGPARSLTRRLDLRAARRLCLAVDRTELSLSDLVTAATARTARALQPEASHAIGVIHQARAHDGQRIVPTRANILPVFIGEVADPVALLQAVHTSTQELLRYNCRREDFTDLCAELGREHPVWTWTTNHYPARNRYTAGPWEVILDPQPLRLITPRPISIETTLDASTGELYVRVKARQTEADTIDPALILDRLIAELDALSQPDVLWQLGMGLLG